MLMRIVPTAAMTARKPSMLRQQHSRDVSRNALWPAATTAISCKSATAAI